MIFLSIAFYYFNTNSNIDVFFQCWRNICTILLRRFHVTVLYCWPCDSTLLYCWSGLCLPTIRPNQTQPLSVYLFSFYLLGATNWFCLNQPNFNQRHFTLYNVQHISVLSSVVTHLHTIELKKGGLYSQYYRLKQCYALTCAIAQFQNY